MKLLAIAQFLIMTWGLGVGMMYLLRESKDPIERNIMRIGIGLSGFLVFMILINFLHIPLDWKVPMIVALIGPGLVLFKKGFKSPKVSWSAETVFSLLVICLFLFNFSMHLKGAFGYDYLEDTDPLIHSLGVKFISIEKGIHGQEALSMMNYIDPYPPGYDIFMATVYQVSHSMTWTLKFFNALIVASGILFFYFVVKRLSGNSWIALGSAATLTFIPCYLSHFIWAHSLVVTMFLVTLYCFLMIDKDKKWLFVAGIALASVYFSQPSQSLKTSILLGILIIGKMISGRSLKKEYWGAAILGGLIGLIWWGTRIFGTIFLGKEEEATAAIGGAGSGKLWVFIQTAFPNFSGTATRVYTFEDLYVVTGQNMINNPIGFGATICLMLFISLAIIVYSIYQKKETFNGGKRYAVQGLAGLAAIPIGLLGLRYVFILFGNPILTSLRIDLYAFLFTALLCSVAVGMNPKALKDYTWIAITLFWLVFTFLGVNSLTFDLPIGLYAFRFWMLLALPVSMIIGFGISRIMKKGFSPFLLPVVIAAIGLMLPASSWIKYSIGIGGAIVVLGLIFSRNIPIGRYVTIAAILFGIVLTAGVPKYQVNTAIWPPEPGMTSYDEIDTYNWLYTLPFDTKVYDLGSGIYTISRDKYQCAWCDYAIELEPRVLTASAEEIHEVLSREGYEYAVVGGNIHRRLRDYFVDPPEKEIADLVQTLDSSPLFTVVHQGQGAIIFRVS